MHRELCRLQVFGRQPVEKWTDSVETFYNNNNNNIY